MAIDGTTLPLPETALSYTAGDVIGRKYRLERLIGEGGMGMVWAARNTALDAPVAVKLIAGTDREMLSARLLREARAAARLRHPATVRVFDVGETQQGDPFIVMELLEGSSLADRLDRDSTLSPVEAVRLLLPIAAALSSAHAAHLVHRDLKPDNIFIVEESGRVQPKLLDFGIVQVARGLGATRLTEVGEFVGTPAYMSPEQARGSEELDHTTDIWSFSVVLYEAMSGRVPFDSDSYNALMREIIEVTPMSLFELGVSDEKLSQIVAIGMDKKPSLRWSSMQDFGLALAEWLLEQGVEQDATEQALRSHWPLAQVEQPRRASVPTPHAAPRVGHWVHALRGTALLLVTGAVLLAFGVFVGRTPAPKAADEPTVVAPFQEPAVVALATTPTSAAPARSADPKPAPPEIVPIESSAPAAVRSAHAPPPARAPADRASQTENQPSVAPVKSAGRTDSLDLVDPY